MPVNGIEALSKWHRWMPLVNEGFGQNPSLQECTEHLLIHFLQDKLQIPKRYWQRAVNRQDSVFVPVGPGCCQSRVRLRGKECGSGGLIWRNRSREKPIKRLSFLNTLWTAGGVLLISLKTGWPLSHDGIHHWPWH